MTTATDELGVVDPTPRTGIAGLVGRPVHLELRSRFEQRDLRRSPLWNGEGFPEGRGRPLLVIPGFMATARSAASLLHVARAAGWRAELAAVGRNSGPAYTSVEAAENDLDRLFRAHGGPLTIIGHSRGGQFARVLAVRHPDKVDRVVTVGAPLRVKYPWFAVVKVPAEVLDRVHRAGVFGPVYPDREDEVDRDRYRPFPSGVDLISIYSRNDGIVDWRTCTDPAATMVEISASHLGLISSIAGLTAIAEALVRPFDGEHRGAG